MGFSSFWADGHEVSNALASSATVLVSPRAFRLSEGNLLPFVGYYKGLENKILRGHNHPRETGKTNVNRAREQTQGKEEIPMAIEKLLDIHDQDTRSQLARMVMKLFDHWNLTSEDQCALLGLAPETQMSLNQYRDGEPLADDSNLLGRVGHLMGIHKALQIIFPHDRDLAYRWVTQPNQSLGGRQPIDVMKEGYEGIVAVRRYLDLELQL